MKRYTIIAIIVITVGLISAFSLSNYGNQSGPHDTTYWFLMDGQGHVTTTQVSDPSDLCPEEGDGCARQYNASQTEILSGIRQVKASQVDLPIGSRAKE